MNQFGVTKPCENIAKHFNVDQAYVDNTMEWVLYEAGIRKQAPGLLSAEKQGALAMQVEFETRISVERALDLVVLDIKAMAKS